MQNYADFLSSKRAIVKPVGFDVSPDLLNPKLFVFQRDIVVWALRLGKAAVFAECGLGKTFIELEWARHVVHQTNGKVLLLAPLAVGQQTVREAEKFGYEDVRYCRTPDDIGNARIVVTNYERLSLFDAAAFQGVVLDESSIMKNLGGKTFWQLVRTFEHTPYKLCGTATPAPNEYPEFANHSTFLGIMHFKEVLARWFIGDQKLARHAVLKKHAAADWWRWVTSWSVCISKPGDLGEAYDMPEFALPPLEIHEHRLSASRATIERTWAGGMLIPDSNPSSTTLHKVKRESLADRVAKAAEIVASLPSGAPAVVWCDTNYEADALVKALPDAVEVRGSHSLAVKEDRLNAFTGGQARVIITKPDIAGFGLNWQHCADHVFVGVSFSFEKTYQALKRSHRFGQSRTVNAHMIYAETEGNVLAVLKRKQREFDQMQERMTAAMNEHGLFRDEAARALSIPESEIVSEDDWTLHLGDCVPAMAAMPDNSVDYCLHSPPFSNLYVYSDSEADMGNSADDAEFFTHYDYVIRELYRITTPGRLCSVHCKDLPAFKNRDGAMGLRDFPGEIIRHFEAAGWQFHSRVTIWKDPVIEMERTNNHGLLHKNFEVRAEVCRQGMADYIVTFRKWTDDAEMEQTGKPISQQRREGDYIGTKPPGAWEIRPGRRTREQNYSIAVWQRYASPVWFDINQLNVLNYQQVKSPDDEKHICVARGSFVLTCHGYRPIEDVEVGEQVLTHRGRWRPVIAKRNMGQRSVIRLTAQGVADLRVTPDHRLWTRLGRTAHPRPIAVKSTPEWIEAQNTLGSYVNLPLPPVVESPLSHDDWWIVGRWLGDGHMSVRGLPFITCAFDEVDELAAKLGGRAGHIGNTQTAAQIYIKGRDGRHGDALHQMIERCGNGAAHKVVPGEALSLEPTKAAALLEGYLSADGHYVAKYQRWTASSISRALLLGMAMVAQRARGVAASVYAGRKARQHMIEGRTVNAKDDWVLSIPPRNLSGMMLDDGAWKKVRSVTDAGEVEVWDIQIEEDESFIVEGCAVHNCPLQLDVIARCIDLWTNAGDVVFSPFAGIGSEGYQAILQGRRFVGVELKRDYFAGAVKYLRQATEKAAQIDLFTYAEMQADALRRMEAEA